MNPFSWVRRMVARAVVQGMQDGCAAIAPTEDEPPTNLDELRQLVARSEPPMLVAASEEASGKGKRNR